MGDNTEEFHILGPKARGVQLTFHVSKEMKHDLVILKALLEKYKIKMNPDGGNHILRIALISFKLFPVADILKKDSNDSLRLIEEIIKSSVENTISGINLSDFDKLQNKYIKDIFDKNAELSREEIAPIITDQLDKLKDKLPH